MRPTGVRRCPPPPASGVLRRTGPGWRQIDIPSAAAEFVRSAWPPESPGGSRSPAPTAPHHVTTRVSCNNARASSLPSASDKTGGLNRKMVRSNAYRRAGGRSQVVGVVAYCTSVLHTVAASETWANATTKLSTRAALVAALHQATPRASGRAIAAARETGRRAKPNRRSAPGHAYSAQRYQ
jgi:hypothetical protein